MTPEQLRVALDNKDPSIKWHAAAHPDMTPELFEYAFKKSKRDSGMRYELAKHPKVPRHIWAKLIMDKEPETISAAATHLKNQNMVRDFQDFCALVGAGIKKKIVPGTLVKYDGKLAVVVGFSPIGILIVNSNLNGTFADERVVLVEHSADLHMAIYG